MAKRPQRTPEQQEYRDNLAHDLKNLREYWDSWKELAETLLRKEKWKDKYVETLGKDRKYWKKAANELIESGQWKYVVENLDKFKWLDKEIAIKLIEEWEWESVAKNLRDFEWLNYKEVAEKLIEKWNSYSVAGHLINFKWLDKEIAIKLIEEWEWEDVADCISIFKWLDKETANKLIESGQWWVVARHPDNFEWLDKRIADKLIREWYWEYVAKYPENFWLERVKKNKEQAENLMELGERSYLASHIDEFDSSYHKYIAERFIEAWRLLTLLRHIRKFKWLDKEVADKLIKDWAWVIVEHNSEIFWLKKEK